MSMPASQSSHDTAYDGPYLGDEYGQCGYGHPVNAFGRCEPLNRDIPACPPAVSTIVDMTGA
jgi:hypothetical protein